MKKKLLKILESYESKEYYVDPQFKIPKCAYPLIVDAIIRLITKEK